jgi:hypothetical protein
MKLVPREAAHDVRFFGSLPGTSALAPFPMLNPMVSAHENLTMCQ